MDNISYVTDCLKDKKKELEKNIEELLNKFSEETNLEVSRVEMELYRVFGAATKYCVKAEVIV